MVSESLPDSLGETLAVFSSSEPLTTAEVANQLAVGRRGTYDRLERLVERGRLETKKVGAKARVWWIPTAAAPVGEEVLGGPATTFIDELNIGVFVLDATDEIIWANTTVCEYFGLRHRDVIGVDQQTLVETTITEVVADGQRFANAVCPTDRDHSTAEQVRCRVTDDATGTERVLEHHSMPIQSGPYEDGHIECYVEVTEQHRLEDALKSERDFIGQVLEVAPVGVLTIEPNGSFELMNRKAGELLELGSSEEELEVGIKAVYDLEGTYLPPEERPYMAAFDTGEPVRNWIAQIELASGGRRWLSTNIEPLTADDGTVEQLLVTIEDVSQLVEQNRMLERQRERLETELEEMLGRVTDAFYALDDQWRFSFVNEKAADLIDVTDEGLIGKHVWETFEWAADSVLREEYERAMETQEATSFEFFYPDPLDCWFRVHTYPSTSGLSVYFRDITDQKERELELERYVSIVDAIDEPIYELDRDGRIVFVNDAFLDLVGYDESEVLGEHVNRGMAPEDIERIGTKLRELATGDGDQHMVAEFDVTTKEGDRIPVENRISLLKNADGTVRGTAGVVRDISDRRTRERERRENEVRYRTLVENIPNGAVALFDEELRYLMTGGSLLSELEIPDGAIGSTIYERYSPELALQFEPHYEAAIEGEASEFEIEYKGRELKMSVKPLPEADVAAGMLLVQDVTERRARERAMEKQIRQQRVVANFGYRALESTEIDELLETATRIVADTLENPFCKVLNLDDQTNELLLQHGVGWKDGVVGETRISATASDSQAAYTLGTDEPVVVEDLGSEPRFGGPDLLTEHDVTSGISVIIGSIDSPWGVLGTHDTAHRSFSEEDVSFVQAIANVLASAIERHRFEQELQTMNELNAIVGEITDRVIEESSRENIEQAVCDILAASDAYRFAWLAEHDPESGQLEPRSSAETDGYADKVTITIDPDDPRSHGPGATAIREQEIQVVQDVFTDPRFEPWRDVAREYGFSSVASIPVVHEGTVYGVLGVYADRPGAFSPVERDVVGRIGEIVGHAIGAIERKRALMSEEIIELEFLIEDVFAAYDPPVEIDNTIVFDHIVPIAEGEFLVYGRADRDVLEILSEAVELVPTWKAVTPRTDSDPSRFELHLCDEKVFTAVAARGGYIDRAELDGGDFRLCIHLAPEVEVRNLIDTIVEEFPGAELLRRQQFRRETENYTDIRRHLISGLTDRQRAVLDTAYNAGYFAWPRETTGADLAQTLDIAPPTFHYHLRRAEEKVMDAVYRAETGAGDAGE